MCFSLADVLWVQATALLLVDRVAPGRMRPLHPLRLDTITAVLAQMGANPRHRARALELGGEGRAAGGGSHGGGVDGRPLSQSRAGWWASLFCAGRVVDLSFNHG